MKKGIALALVLFMLLGSALAEIPKVDFDKMTLDELDVFYRIVLGEFQKRGEDEACRDMIYAGSYVAGKDIKPGKYQAIAIMGDYESCVQIGSKVYFPTHMDRNGVIPPCVFYLKDGDIMILNFVGILIDIPEEQKPSWAM